MPWRRRRRHDLIVRQKSARGSRSWDRCSPCAENFRAALATSAEDKTICRGSRRLRTGTALALWEDKNCEEIPFMANELEGMKIAILATHGVEQSELTEPKKALEEAGAKTCIVSPERQIKGWQHTKWGRKFKVDEALETAHADSFDALVLPGGVMNPDYLRWTPKAVQFVGDFVASQKPIAAICHGPWTLIEAGAVRGRRLTSWPSLRSDLTNAGAQWVDEEVVVDDGWGTSRKPDDLPAFNKKIIEVFAAVRSQADSAQAI